MFTLHIITASSDFNTHPYTLVTCTNTRALNNEVIIAKDGLAVEVVVLINGYMLARMRLK